MLTEPTPQAKHSQRLPPFQKRHQQCLPTRLIGILLATAIASICIATEPEPPSLQTCLWRAQSSNTTVYLQGSIHLLSKDAYPLPRQIENAFKASQQIVLEVDLTVMSDPDKQLEIVLKGMLPNHQTLDSILSPKTLKKAETCARTIGMPMMAFKHYKPWMFVMALTAVRLEQLGFSPENGLDWHFYRRATEAKKPVIGLETIDEQLSLLDEMAGTDQDAFVWQSLEDFTDIEKEMTTIVTAWRTGDINALAQSLLGNLKKYPNVHKRLIRDRNTTWMKHIETIMQGGVTSMIVVGAGHLPGPDGLIALLKDRGYTVEQL